MSTSGRIFTITVILYLGLTIAHALAVGKTVYGDGRFYYAWLRSSVFDRNIDFTDEYRYFSAAQLPAANGLPGNKYSIGPAILWLFPYTLLSTATGGTGYEFRYHLVTAIAGTLYAVTGLILIYRYLLKITTQTAAQLTVLSLAFATNLLFYGAVDTVNSHPFSFFAVSLFLVYLLSPRPRPLISGILLGLVFLIRPQDTLVGLLFLSRKKPFGSFIRFLTGLFLSLSWQLAAWFALYRTVIPPYFLGGEGFRPTPVNLIPVLFSPENGLLLWNPVLIAAFFGLGVRWNRKKNLLNGWLLTIPLLEIFIIAFWSTASQGASYGSRMFVGMLPVMSFGLAGFYTKLLKYRLRLKQILAAIVLPLSILNALFIFYFLASRP